MIGKGLLRAQKFKALIRSFPLIGEMLFTATITLTRRLREWQITSNLPYNDSISERMLPCSPEPWKFLLSDLAKFSRLPEVDRRRNAYFKCAKEAFRVGAVSIFASLPANSSPYGFPFRGSDAAVDAMKIFASACQYEMVKWPDLPDEIVKNAPSYYLDIFLINFMH